MIVELAIGTMTAPRDWWPESDLTADERADLDDTILATALDVLYRIHHRDG